MTWVAHLEWSITTWKRNPKTSAMRRMVPTYREGEVKLEAPTHKQAMDKVNKHLKRLTLDGSTEMSYSVCLDRKDQLT